MIMASTRRWHRAMLAGIVSALGMLGPSYGAPSQPLLDRLPGLVLWAWERPEDLRGLDRDVAVAFLAQTIDLKVDGVQVSPRRQPLRVDPETPLIAVTRVGTTASSRDSGSVVDRVARTVADTAGLPGVKAVQIDFDAVRSERPFYRHLLRRVKDMLDANTAVDDGAGIVVHRRQVMASGSPSSHDKHFRRCIVCFHKQRGRSKRSIGTSWKLEAGS